MTEFVIRNRRLPDPIARPGLPWNKQASGHHQWIVAGSQNPYIWLDLADHRRY